MNDRFTSRYAVAKNIDGTNYYHQGQNFHGAHTYATTPERQYENVLSAAEVATEIGGTVENLPVWQWNV